jgi:hypothetical protein
MKFSITLSRSEQKTNSSEAEIEVQPGIQRAGTGAEPRFQPKSFNPFL